MRQAWGALRSSFNPLSFLFFPVYLEILFAPIIKSLLPCGSRGSECGREEATGAGSRGGGTARGQGQPYRFRARLITAHLGSPSAVAAVPSHACLPSSHPHRSAGASPGSCQPKPGMFPGKGTSITLDSNAVILSHSSKNQDTSAYFFLFLQIWHKTVSLSCLSKLRSVEGF